MYILKYGIKNTTECLLINRIYLIYSNLVITGTSIRLCILSLRISAKDPYPTLHTFLSDFCEGYSKCCFDSETGSYHHISAQHCILPLRVSAKGHLPTLHTLPFGFLRRLMKKIFWRFGPILYLIHYIYLYLSILFSYISLFYSISSNLHPTLHTFLSDFCEGSPSNTAYFPFWISAKVGERSVPLRFAIYLS
jgi:hypothetical protein